MESAPASIPATTHDAFTAELADGTLDRSASNSCSPARSASRITGTKPADPIRFGSSKTASTLWSACAPSDRIELSQVQSSCPTGAFARHDPPPATTDRWIRAQRCRC